MLPDVRVSVLYTSRFTARGETLVVNTEVIPLTRLSRVTSSLNILQLCHYLFSSCYHQNWIPLAFAKSFVTAVNISGYVSNIDSPPTSGNLADFTKATTHTGYSNLILSQVDGSSLAIVKRTVFNSHLQGRLGLH